jgi:hypothetical protein
VCGGKGSLSRSEASLTRNLNFYAFAARGDHTLNGYVDCERAADITPLMRTQIFEFASAVCLGKADPVLNYDTGPESCHCNVLLQLGFHEGSVVDLDYFR